MSWFKDVFPFFGVAGPVFSGLAERRAAAENAANRKFEADRAIATSKAEAGRQRAQSEQIQSSFRAQVGHQGTTFEGSPLLVYIENQKQAALEEQDILYQGQIQAEVLRRKAEQSRREGQTALFTGLTKGAYSLGSTLLKP